MEKIMVRRWKNKRGKKHRDLKTKPSVNSIIVWCRKYEVTFQLYLHVTLERMLTYSAMVA